MGSHGVLLLCLTLVACSSDTCEKDDMMCQDQNTIADQNTITDVLTRLRNVEELKQTNLNRAYEEMKSLYLSEPEDPRVLFLMCKVQVVIVIMMTMMMMIMK